MAKNISQLSCIPIEDIYAARDTLNGKVTRTPLIPLELDIPNKKIYLKLENLQPVRSFKLRGACNAMSGLSESQLEGGVWTPSAGNFAQGLAYSARRMGVECHVVAPDHIPGTKEEAIKRLGGHVHKVPFSTWWQVVTTRQHENMKGHFVHPVCEYDVIAGNGTIGLEILEDLPDVDTIICPVGGGGMISGVGSVLRALRPTTRLVACEVETAAPVTESLAAGKPVTVQNHRTSFVDGMGGKSVLDDMWSLLSSLVADTVVLSLEQVADAVRLLVMTSSIVAEGAGAAPVAAALTSDIPDGNIVCVISGGNIDCSVLATILQGGVPQ